MDCSSVYRFPSAMQTRGSFFLLTSLTDLCMKRGACYRCALLDCDDPEDRMHVRITQP